MKFEDTYITIKGWMSSVLELKGNELLAFALIYGFSQDGQSEAKSSITYVQKWLNCSRPTAINAIKSLVGKRYIMKRQIIENGDKRNYYRANVKLISEQLKNFTSAKFTSKETLPPTSKETLPPTSKETLPPTSKETLPSIYTSINSNSNKGESKDSQPQEDKFYKVKGLKTKIGPKHYSLLNNACEDKEIHDTLRGLFLDGRFSQLTDWLEYKKESKKGYSAKSAIKKLIAKFSKYTPYEIETAVETSITSGHVGVFPKKFSDKQVSSGGAKLKSILSRGRRKVDVV